MSTDQIIPEAAMQQMSQDAARVPAEQRIENFERDGAQVVEQKAFHRLSSSLCVVLGLDYAFGAESKDGLSSVLVGPRAEPANAYAPFALARPDADLPTGIGRLALNRVLDYLREFNQHQDGTLVLCEASSLREYINEAVSAAVDRMKRAFDGVAVGGNLTDENVTLDDLMRFDFRLSLDPRMTDPAETGTFKHELNMFLVVNCPNLYNSENPAKAIRQVQNSINAASSKSGVDVVFALLTSSPAAITCSLLDSLSQEYSFTPANAAHRYVLQPVAIRDVERRDLNREWLPEDVDGLFADNDLLLVADEVQQEETEAIAKPSHAAVADDDSGDDDLIDDEDAEDDTDDIDAEDEDDAEDDTDDIDAEDEDEDDAEGDAETSVQFSLGMYVASVDLMRSMAQDEKGPDKANAKASYVSTRNDFIAFMKENVRELFAMRELFDATARGLLKALHRASSDEAVTAAGVDLVKYLLSDESISTNMCSADPDFAAGYDAIMSDEDEDADETDAE